MSVCVCAILYVSSDLAIGSSPVQGVLTAVYKVKVKGEFVPVLKELNTVKMHEGVNVQLHCSRPRR
jgi:hypothetical protein